MNNDPLSHNDIPEETDVPPTKSTMLNTRVLDNHYDPRVHEKAWIAPGHLKDYQYNYSDSGLGYTMNKPHKLRQFKDRHEQIAEVDEMNKKTKGFRHFREYDNVMNNEIVVTIEYCTNCRHHQGSTRHDEEKYAYFANTLKREIITHYPIVKVYLKPLLFEQNDESSEAIYLRSRIGALEVQLMSKNSNGVMNKKIVFSKLKTRAWPSVGRVVEDITKYLPTDDFVVRLIDPNYKFEEDKQDNNRPTSSKKPVSKLKGLHVIIRPVKTVKKGGNFAEMSNSKMGESSRFQTLGTSRPNSAAVRPRSAYSVTSNKSTASGNKTLQIGNENFVPSGSGNEFVEQADNFGVILFKQIPHNIYEIEVLETQNYLPEKRVVNVFEMVEQGIPLKEEFVLKEQTMGFCRIRVTEGGMPFSDSSIIVAKKNPEPSSKTAVLREKDPKSGVFEFMIDPGSYILAINKLGFNERKEEVTIDRGVNEFAFEVTQPSTYTGNGEGYRYQDHSDRPNSRQRPTSSKGRHGESSAKGPGASRGLDVIPQEREHEDQHPIPLTGVLGIASDAAKNNNNNAESEKLDTDPHGEEEKGVGKKQERVKSALVKKVEFSVHDVDSEKPVAGAQIILEEIGFRGTTNEQGKCLVPVNKLNSGKLVLNHDDFFGMVEEYGGEDGADLKSGSEKKFYLIPRPGDLHEVQLRFLPANGAKCAKFSVLHAEQGENAKKDIIVKHGNDGKEVIILKNLLKKNGVFRIIAEISDIDEFLHPESTFILSHYEDCDPLYIFPPPENMLDSSKLIWDVGFFADPAANPQFVEINGYSNKAISLHSHLKEYQLLLNYLHNSKSDLKTLLGFKDKNRIERDGDIFISKDTIYASLDKYGLEIKNVDHLLSSARSVEGLYSFRECERRFGTLRPPFNFVKGTAKHDHNHSVSSKHSEGEEEYIFEDDQ